MGVSPLARTDNAWGEWGLARMAVYVSYALHARCSRTSVATMRDERPHQTCAESVKVAGSGTVLWPNRS